MHFAPADTGANAQGKAAEEQSCKSTSSGSRSAPAPPSKRTTCVGHERGPRDRRREGQRVECWWTGRSETQGTVQKRQGGPTGSRVCDEARPHSPTRTPGRGGKARRRVSAQRHCVLPCRELPLRPRAASPNCIRESCSVPTSFLKSWLYNYIIVLVNTIEVQRRAGHWYNVPHVQ